MDLQRLADKLHPLERNVLPILERESSILKIAEKSGLKEVEVMRALQWLQNKRIVQIKEKPKEIASLGKLGLEYKKEGLPERRFLLAAKPSPLPIDVIMEKAKLSRQELNAVLGLLRSKKMICIAKKEGMMYAWLLKPGIAMLKKESVEERFLKKRFPLDVASLELWERHALEQLKRRKGILRVRLVKERYAELTDLGRRLLAVGIRKGKVIDRLTPEMLQKGTWVGKRFRRYDIGINVPKIWGGKRHFLLQAKEHARRIWLELGFKEMVGPIINTSFWNFDALFTAQDHPVRELHDTFYIKEPEKGRLPNRQLVEAVKAAHESGGNTGSTGWRYAWREEEAKRNVLRTHTTVLSARTLYALRNSRLPAKFFSFGRCYRNEAVDWAHLFEFNQTEGIVVDENANFRHLLGYLKVFFEKMGFKRARFRPAYFPYTEPSVEVEVFHPTRKEWIELGGAGMFRPELVVPLLGKDVPVLAWGPGFDRIVMDYYKLDDMRDLYKNDLKQIREMRCWM